MYVAGRDALSAVENAINDVRSNESRLADVLRSAASEAERLRTQLAESFRALALIRLDTLIRNRAVGELDAAERRALDLLRTHKAKVDQLLIRHGGAQSAVVAAEADHRAKTAAVEAAGEPIKTLQYDVEKKLAADPGWIAQKARLTDITKMAEAGDEKAKQAEADRETKGKPYEADPLFMYLWKRKFATADYKAGNVVRFFDRQVAALVGYDTARPNYMSLNEIPLRLREHAGELVKRVEAEDRKLEQIERAGLMDAGILALETRLTTTQAELKAATDTLAKAQAALTALDKERTALLDQGDRKAHDEALAVLSQAIAREDVQTMYREARTTPTPDDDRIVQQIETNQGAIAKAEAEVAKIRDEAREIARRRGELEGVRDKVRTNRYDGPWGQFELDGNDALGNLIGGIVKGAIQGAVLWNTFERGYRKRRDWDDDDDDDRDGGERGSWGSSRPRFRLPSSSFPKVGGFKIGGGGRSGGGFKTGGRF
ncbi:MAG: hypothetical protein KBA31_20880 [Alphaproteobacteria bacterium]|nr:hypothetical protein [Alphaproteobacteria bacterium]